MDRLETWEIPFTSACERTGSWVAGRTMTLAWKVPPTYRERKLRDTKQGGARGPRKRSK